MAENMCPNASKPDMFFIPQKTFEALKKKVAKGTKLTDKEVGSLVDWTIKDNELVIPVDMNGASENLDDFEAALKTLGPAKAFACFCEAQKHFENVSKRAFSEETRPKPITAKEWKIQNGEDDDDEDDTFKYVPDLFHVPKSTFEAIKKKLAAGEPIAKDEVNALVNWTAPETDTLVPVDMNGTDEDLDEFDEVLEKLDPKIIAKCFVQAEQRFEEKKGSMAEEKLKIMTIKEYKATHNEDDDENEDGSEEEGDEDEDSDGEDDDEDDEPAAKKAKTA